MLNKRSYCRSII